MYKFLLFACICSFQAVLLGARRDYVTSERVTDAEIQTVVGDMRRLDTNKASSRDVVLSYQGHTNSRGRVDNARNKFISSVSSNLLRRPSYKALMDLFDNYNPATGYKERSSRTKDREVDAFLDVVMRSAVMKKVQGLLARKGYTPAKTPAAFRAKLKTYWFDTYSRARGQQDTSGFEHVFIGEWKKGVSGLHNWLRFYKLEQSGDIDYKGFILKRNNIFAMIQYAWGSNYKPSGSFFIGTSPEFDFALYSLCFIAKPGYNTCKFTIDGQKFTVTSYDTTQNRKVYIGTLFPSPARR